MVYDLRSPKTLTKTFIAHNTSVTSMVFKHKVAQVMSVVKTRPKLAKHKSTRSLRTLQVETKENTEGATKQARRQWRQIERRRKCLPRLTKVFS